MFIHAPYWTITPHAGSDATGGPSGISQPMTFTALTIYNTGDLWYYNNFYQLQDGILIRPVINFVSSIEIIRGGEGTQNNPYVVKTN